MRLLAKADDLLASATTATGASASFAACAAAPAVVATVRAPPAPVAKADTARETTAVLALPACLFLLLLHLVDHRIRDPAVLDLHAPTPA